VWVEYRSFIVKNGGTYRHHWTLRC